VRRADPGVGVEREAPPRTCPRRPAPPPAPRRLQLRATGRVGECCAGGCAEPPGCGRRCSVRPGAGCETLGPVAAERRARADALQVLRATWTRLVWRARPYAGNHGCRGHRVAHVLWPGSETRDRTESLELGWERDAKWVAGRQVGCGARAQGQA
jgi:hypothetical protein